MVGENCCIFSGYIKDVMYREGLAENGPWNWVKAKLQIASREDNSQVISLIAWGDHACQINEMGAGTKIKVLCWYNPSVFKGKLQDTFEVDSLIKLEND